MFARLLAISALASYAVARFDSPFDNIALTSGLTPECSSALSTIVTNADINACLTPSPLLPLFSGSGNDSIVPPIDNWLNSLCAAGSCSNATLAAIVTNATTGCSVELSALGYKSSETAGITAAIQKYYPVVRNFLCLKDGNTNCITQTLKSYESFVGGALSIENIMSSFGSGAGISNVPTNVTCSNCAKAAYIVIESAFPELTTENRTASAQAQCGASFTNGTMPAGISQSASNKNVITADPKGSGALRLGIVIGLSALAIILGAFVVL